MILDVRMVRIVRWYVMIPVAEIGGFVSRCGRAFFLFGLDLLYMPLNVSQEPSHAYRSTENKRKCTGDGRERLRLAARYKAIYPGLGDCGHKPAQRRPRQ